MGVGAAPTVIDGRKYRPFRPRHYTAVRRGRIMRCLAHSCVLRQLSPHEPVPNIEKETVRLNLVYKSLVHVILTFVSR
jgi:hypothetical protein